MVFKKESKESDAAQKRNQQSQDKKHEHEAIRYSRK